MSLPWENYLAVIELLSLVCSSDLPRGTLSTCLSDTPILGSGHVMLYPLDTVPTRGGGLTPSGGDLKQVQNTVIFKSKRDRV